MDKEIRLSKVVNSSGFPFQIAVEYQIKKFKDVHGWDIVLHEHQWNNSETGNEGFIDLIISAYNGTQTIVIECKKVSGGEWIFLVPEGRKDTHHGQCLHFGYSNGKFKSSGWIDRTVEPASPRSEFCIIKGQNEQRPTLERIAGILLESTESFAIEETKLNSSKTLPYIFNKFYFPVVVTNSKIYVCHYDPKNISLVDGKVRNGIYNEVPSVRFRKSLSTSQDIKEKNFSTISEVNKARERSIYVLNSNHLTQYLTDWEIP